MNKKKRFEILSLFYKKNSNPKIELVFSSDFELLLSVILSAKSTDVMVNKITGTLFQIANTPQSILKLGFNKLRHYIKSIGLYNTKSLNIINSAYLIKTKYNNKVPSNRTELESLPGVGRKTANIILNVLFNKNTIAVDTHVFRVANRTGFAKGKNVIEVEKKMIKIVPSIFKKYVHFWFVLHGRYVCTARQLKCKTCFIEKLCEFDKKK
ncbi:endonuclease III [Buchnera aphidicola]|uniref:Endonuclease III n=1 Tax=Buchnera aphidicola subsp. Schizaphis graminum (strain Sg) TaxID=198804 RepID=END3_BUCAP|nr:endonuclease III [Buchnera aphidicola]Q8KA16.1 RecName: Full=Endonuclease III; AltName: Full=DNA-(apurinic or apyrimidinic site) lyase [Buchnera aphidicola str. Sg (Schizaphis graminum)]AAM67680.1 endonuclease III [Buchnera aphidicola str. Sg (Schizaphis graminum)]AWI49823.1 endonuclease III [Buchnera aphidicola (Schizaphis graminum)]